jgi:hypothetical protein
VPDWLEQVLSKALQTDPAKRYETAEEWLLNLEHGELKTLNTKPRPLLEREPLKVWRTVALVSLLVNLVVIVWVLHR